MKEITAQDVAAYQAERARLEPLYAKLGVAFDDEDTHMVSCMRTVANRIAAASGSELKAVGTWDERAQILQPGSQTAQAKQLGETIKHAKANAPQVNAGPKDIGDLVADRIAPVAVVKAPQPRDLGDAVADRLCGVK